MSAHVAFLLALQLTPTSGAAAGRPVEPVGLVPRVAAFALDYLPIAGYLALLTAVGAGLGWAFPEAAARAFGQAARAQAIGFANNDAGVLLEIIIRKFLFQQLCRTAQSPQRVLDFMRQIANQ